MYVQHHFAKTAIIAHGGGELDVVVVVLHQIKISVPAVQPNTSTLIQTTA
jgi:hypothetical protein